MILLIAGRAWLMRQGKLSHGFTLGIEFWAALYIPIVVAMASIQNVVAAVRGGPVVLLAGGDKRSQAADVKTALRLARELTE